MRKQNQPSITQYFWNKSGSKKSNEATQNTQDSQNKLAQSQQKPSNINIQSQSLKQNLNSEQVSNKKIQMEIENDQSNQTKKKSKKKGSSCYNQEEAEKIIEQDPESTKIKNDQSNQNQASGKKKGKLRKLKDDVQEKVPITSQKKNKKKKDDDEDFDYKQSRSSSSSSSHSSEEIEELELKQFMYVDGSKQKQKKDIKQMIQLQQSKPKEEKRDVKNEKLQELLKTQQQHLNQKKKIVDEESQQKMDIEIEVDNYEEDQDILKAIEESKKLNQQQEAVQSKSKSKSKQLMEIEQSKGKNQQQQEDDELKKAIQESMKVYKNEKDIQSKSPKKDSRQSGKLQVTEKKQQDGGLVSLIFVLTGVIPNIPRDTLEKIIKENGGKVTGSVSGKTNYLIIGEVLEDGRAVEEGRKYKAAKAQQKCQILSSEEFENLFFQKTGKKVTDYLADQFDKKVQISSASTQQQQPYRQLSAKPMIPCKPIQKAGENIVSDSTNQQKKEENSKQIQNQQVDQEQNSNSISSRNLNGLWTEVYCPRSLKNCVGNIIQTKNITEWLLEWDDVQINGNLKEEKKIWNGQFSQKINVNAKALLISGPPGIGKTTAIRLIAKEYGYELIEQNASDVRNKKAINLFLTDLKDNQVLGFDKSKDMANKRKRLILMDEVDGMSTGDRGGNQELIKIIKETKTPIICICNDAMSQKVRTLESHCYHIKFIKPTKQQLAKRLMQIAGKENISTDELALETLCEGLNNDIRQCLNTFQMWARKSKSLKFQDAKQKVNEMKKDDVVMLTQMDAATKLMTRFVFEQLNLFQLMELFFLDYDWVPLFIQQNYLSSIQMQQPPQSKKGINDLQNLAKAADSIAESDIVDKSIRTGNNWGLLPSKGFLSCVYPCEKVCQKVGFIKFIPEWLAKNSSQKKVYRLLRELRQILGEKVTGSRFSIKFDYAEPLCQLIAYNMMLGKDNLQTVLQILEEYNLSIDNLKEQLVAALFPGEDPFKVVPTATKTALTKLYKQSQSNDQKSKAKKKTQSEENKKYDVFAGDFLDDQEDTDSTDEKDGEDNEDSEGNQSIDQTQKLTNKTQHKQQSKRGQSKKGKP